MPYAKPLRRTNHSSKYSVVGVKRSPQPVAEMTPCVRINCHNVVEKDERRKPVAARKRPMGPKYRRRRGHRVRMKKVNGEMRYMIPCIPISTREHHARESDYETHSDSRPNHGNASRLSTLQRLGMTLIVLLKYTKRARKSCTAISQRHLLMMSPSLGWFVSFTYPRQEFGLEKTQLGQAMLIFLCLLVGEVAVRFPLGWNCPMVLHGER